MSAPRPKAPVLSLGGAALVLLTVVALILLSAPRAIPPAIAEIAPQAVKQIEEPPPEQQTELDNAPDGKEGRSDGGTSGGDGGPGNGEPDSGSNGSRSAPGQASGPNLSNCVGNPPRQTEDPQSPPCVPFWEGNNGGATSRGVTADSIRIGVPSGQTTFAPLLQHFNARYTFYGRKLVAVPLDFGESINSADPLNQCPPELQQNHANAAYDAEVFGATMYYCFQGYAFYKKAAEKKIVAVESWGGSYIEPELASLHPYLWQYSMAVDRQLEVVADWMCSRWQGTAQYAGPGLTGQQRTPAVVMINQRQDALDTRAFERALAACGLPLAVAPKRVETQAQMTAATLDFKANDVTTVLCLCIAPGAGDLARTATSQGYFPEWLYPSFQRMDSNEPFRTPGVQGPDDDQAQRAFGLAFRPRQIVPAADPAWQAYAEFAPVGPVDVQRMEQIRGMYEGLLVLASGIQLAGPQLTPERFAAALQSTVFPNPEHPIRPGHVGFPGRSHSMTVDAVEWYFDTVAKTPYSNTRPGSLCYLDGGARRGLGGFARALFQRSPTCDSGAR